MNWSIPKRYLQLDLFDGRQKLSENALFSSLNIDNKVNFNITSTVTGASAEANIIIGGLDVENMVYLSTSFSVWTRQQIRNKVYLYAGYEDNYALIYVGDIIEATPNMVTANYSITLKCLSSFNETINTIKSYSFSGQKNIIEILNLIANELGFTLINGLTDNVFINNYSFSNVSLMQHIRNISNITNTDIYIDTNRLVVKKRGYAIEKYSTYTINSTNMIGSPIPTNQGCRIKIKLDPTVRTGQLVKIESLKFPQLNLYDFIIQTIGTKGDTRGNDWYNELNMIRRDIYEQ